MMPYSHSESIVKLSQNVQLKESCIFLQLCIVTIDRNTRVNNILDLNLGLSISLHNPYCNPNENLLQMNRQSNHLRVIFKFILNSISTRLSKLSANSHIYVFVQNAQIYNYAFVRAGYAEKITCLLRVHLFPLCTPPIKPFKLEVTKFGHASDNVNVYQCDVGLQYLYSATEFINKNLKEPLLQFCPRGWDMHLTPLSPQVDVYLPHKKYRYRLHKRTSILIYLTSSGAHDKSFPPT